MKEKIINRTDRAVREFLSREEFEIIRQNYAWLKNVLKKTRQIGTLTPNLRVTQMYDEFQTILPGFLSRFYCIVAKSYVYDLRKENVEQDKLKKMKDWFKMLTESAELPESTMDVVYLHPSDKLHIVLKNVDTGIYWLINNKLLQILDDYLDFVAAADNYEDYKRTVREKFLLAGLFRHLVFTLHYPEAYSAAPEQLREYFPYWLA